MFSFLVNGHVLDNFPRWGAILVRDTEGQLIVLQVKRSEVEFTGPDPDSHFRGYTRTGKIDKFGDNVCPEIRGSGHFVGPIPRWWPPCVSGKELLYGSSISILPDGTIYDVIIPDQSLIRFMACLEKHSRYAVSHPPSCQAQSFVNYQPLRTLAYTPSTLRSCAVPVKLAWWFPSAQNRLSGWKLGLYGVAPIKSHELACTMVSIRWTTSVWFARRK